MRHHVLHRSEGQGPAAACLGICLVLASLAGCGGGSPVRPTGVSTSTPTPGGSPSTGGTPPTPPAPTPPAPRPPTLAATRFLAFGDSMTQGHSATIASRPMDLTPVTSYPSLLERELRSIYTAQDVRVTNSGRSGEWVEDGEFRFRTELQVLQPDAVLLLEGANDLATYGEKGIDPSLDALDYMIQLARVQGAAVFVATLPPQRPGGARAASAKLVPIFNAGIRRVATRRGAVLVDLEAAFGTDYSLLSEDGLHPNSGGYELMARQFLAAIRATLEKPAADGSRADPRVTS